MENLKILVIPYSGGRLYMYLYCKTRDCMIDNSLKDVTLSNKRISLGTGE